MKRDGKKYEASRGRTILSAIVVLACAMLAAQSALAQDPDVPNAPNGGYDVPAPSEPTPNDDPMSRLGEVAGQLDALAAGAASPKLASSIARAAGQSRKALQSFSAIEPKLKKSVAAARAALKSIAVAERVNTDPGLDADLDAPTASLVATARSIAVGIVELATAAGVESSRIDAATAQIAAGDAARDAGDSAGAAALYGKGLKLKNAVDFDPALFRANIEAAMVGQATGYAAALVRNGKLVNDATWAMGAWRTNADAPFTSATTTAEINIASITKTITAASLLYLIQDPVLGDLLTIDDPIGPYLPSDWARGNNVDDITFRDLLTHRSGLANNASGGRTSFSDIQGFVATDITMGKGTDGRYPYTYQNANFALFRILFPYMTGYTSSIGQHCNAMGCAVGTAQSTSESYRLFIQCDVLNLVGLSEPYVPFGDDPYGCEGPDMVQNPDEAPMTLLYNPSLPFNSGVDPGDWTLFAGGGGWYMSAVELAEFLAHLRYDNDFLTKASRKLMYENYLGFMNSDAQSGNFSFGSGKLGSYRMHGGDLCYPSLPVPAGQSGCNLAYQPSGVDTCIADFPDGTQAVLLINSMGGSYPYQCTVLKNAYEAAWVKK